LINVAQDISTEISEIFSSIQGEGVYLGKKQIFVRFGLCNMHCTYCDELPKMQKGAFETLSLESVLEQVQDLETQEGEHHSISLTGGEPLFYSNFLEALLPELKERGFKTYLETNGTLPQLLKKHIGLVDIVSMDLKPPSSTGDRAFWLEQAEFLKVAHVASMDVFTKLVVTEKILDEEILQCIELVKSIDSKIPFILQPVSESGGPNKAAMKRIEDQYFKLASMHLRDVRIIPQMHKVWGIR
jgi:7-carboxy-7-deazaguanine synthase